MTSATAALAASLIELAGGASNIVSVDRCYVRLRLTLRDLSGANLVAINALAGVALAIVQSGQLQIAPATGLEELHRAVSGAVGPGGPPR